MTEGILALEGIKPMGAGLHDPFVICLPLVSWKLGLSRQKLIKLFVDVSDATCPGSEGSTEPFWANPGAITAGSSVRDVCAAVLMFPDALLSPATTARTVGDALAAVEV